MCADGLPAPCLVLLVVDVQYKAALQPIPLAGREENSSADTQNLCVKYQFVVVTCVLCVLVIGSLRFCW